MAEETTEQFLARRERELMSRAAALRGQLLPIESELAHVQKMRTLISAPQQPVEMSATPHLRLPSIAEFRDGKLQAAAATPMTLALAELGTAENPFANRTIKDLAIQALIDGFPDGATIAQIKEFIFLGYRRNVDQGSLRTQLHRLKAAGILGQEPANDTWNFRDGQRALYSRYDHPTSRRSDARLQDDSEDDAFMKQLEAMAWREEDDKK